MGGLVITQTVKDVIITSLMAKHLSTQRRFRKFFLVLIYFVLGNMCILSISGTFNVWNSASRVRLVFLVTV